MQIAIHILDLATPVLTPMQREAIAAASSAQFQLTGTAVLDAARERTGLADFGADDFRERLGFWLRSIEEDTGLGPLGRLGLFEDCVRHAANRLRIEALLKLHPQILQSPIDRPLIIAGLPRSGTTNLVNLVATDERLRSMPLWEGMEPVPAPQDSEDSRRRRTQQAWGQFEDLLPHMPAMHEMAPDHVHEDIELQQPDFGSYNLEWGCRAHAWQGWYLQHDRTPQYQYAKRVHQILSWQRGPSRWIMKSPQHMENLRPLMSTYADARVVITHRDPVAVIQSIVTMLAYGDRIRRRQFDLPALADYWIGRIELLLRACVDDRHVLPPARSLDVLFHEYMADTSATIKRIYTLADLELTPQVIAAHEAYARANARGKHGQVAYDLRRDFGVDIGLLRERFGFYYSKFPVRREAVAGELA